MSSANKVVQMAPDYVVHTVQVFEKDLKAVWKLLAERNPEVGETSAIPEAEARMEAPEATAKATAEVKEWTEKQLADFYGMCQPVQRAILVCVAEAGVKGTPAAHDEFLAAAAAASIVNPFTDRHLSGNLAWITKYAIKLGSNEGPFENFFKEGVWYFQMEPATAKTILRLREKFGN
jgi:hypothetical protein